MSDCPEVPMATLVKLTVQDPQDVLDTFGTGALIRIERDTSAAMGTASEVTTIAVVAGTTEYEYRDQTGVAGTHYYRSRYSKATPSGDTDYSGYGSVFRAGTPGGQVITLETVKTWAVIGDTEDDGWLPMLVNAINRAIIRGIGVDIGPSPDTTRTYDACDAVRGGRRLWVPGGLRTFATVEVSTDGSTWTAVTSDVRIGPAEHERPAGEPGAYIEFKPYTSGSATFSGYRYVRITGTAFATFGWDAYPDDLVQAAVAAAIRMMRERQGRSDFINETNAIRYIDPNLLRSYRSIYFPGAR